MHDLSMNVGIQRFTDGQDGFVNTNFRYPQNTTADAIEKHVAQSLPVGFDAVAKQEGHAQVPHYVPGNDPLVKTLLQVYREHTGLPADENVIGWGTFGRFLTRVVALCGLKSRRLHHFTDSITFT